MEFVFRFYAPPLPEGGCRTCKIIDTKLNDVRIDAAQLVAMILENALEWRKWLDEMQQRIENAKALSPVDRAEIHALRLRMAEQKTFKSVVSRDVLFLDWPHWRDRWIGELSLSLASASDVKLKRGIPRCCRTIMELAGIDKIGFRVDAVPLVQVGAACEELVDCGLELLGKFADLHTNHDHTSLDDEDAYYARNPDGGSSAAIEAIATQQSRCDALDMMEVRSACVEIPDKHARLLIKYAQLISSMPILEILPLHCLPLDCLNKLYFKWPEVMSDDVASFRVGRDISLMSPPNRVHCNRKGLPTLPSCDTTDAFFQMLDGKAFFDSVNDNHKAVILHKLHRKQIRDPHLRCLLHALVSSFNENS